MIKSGENFPGEIEGNQRVMHLHVKKQGKKDIWNWKIMKLSCWYYH